MNQSNNSVDAVIIGGGFYGCSIAVYLAKTRGLRNILLVEREDSLLSRASYNNQARVHNGYHYPRSFTTAYRSRVNLPKFVHDWPLSVKKDFTKVYAIARRNSKVNAKQFLRFCNEVGAKVQPAETSVYKLFEPRLIEDVFLVEEYAFDTTFLKKWAEDELRDNGVEIRFQTRVTEIFKNDMTKLILRMKPDHGDLEQIECKYVFNCAYSGLNQLRGHFSGTRTGLKQEITEMALMQVPKSLKDLGITVMDGPFFSLMPFPARGLHTLSHVRYTPHFHWKDEAGIDPYQKLDSYDRSTRVDRMIRDVGRYLPAIYDAKYINSLFEVKTILEQNESDDGRPILFEKHINLSGCYSVLGGKIDNIYDILERLDEEDF
jgi:glycine/D-amino acid oxidase-like deaminating enzyme